MLMVRFAVTVPMVGQEDPAVHVSQTTSLVACLLLYKPFEHRHCKMLTDPDGLLDPLRHSKSISHQHPRIRCWV